MDNIADEKPDPATETKLIGVLERFCSAFADRDADGVMHLVVPDGDVVVVTSEEPLLRGASELMDFLDRYLRGPTTYSWEWDRHDSQSRGRSHGCSPREPRQRRAPTTSGDTGTG
jgi:SnoaL-like domain